MPRINDGKEKQLRPDGAEAEEPKQQAHTKWEPTSLSAPTIRLCRLRNSIASTRTTHLAMDIRECCGSIAPEQSGDGLVGPLSGAGRTWKAVHHLVRTSAETVIHLKRWPAFPPQSGPHQLVGIATFRDRVIGRFLRRSCPFSSGQSCNCPSCPGGSSLLPSDDWKLT